MNPKKRVLLLIAIMASLTVIVESISIVLLYKTAFTEEKLRLEEIAKNQARLIESIAGFNAVYSNDYPFGPEAATLSQIIEAHQHYEGFGETGEFTLARKEDDKIIFLLSHRHFDLGNPKPIAFDSKLAEPMRRALSGDSGTIIGPDYRGETVLAAFEPVAVLNLGIVAKIDIAEIRQPFLQAAIYSGLVGIVALLIGTAFFVSVTNPLLNKLYQTISDLKKAMAEIKVLSGFLPICASCKKIRDDKGLWNNVEEYIRARSDAEFTHGICPDCARKHYPKLMTDKNQADRGR